MTYTFAAVQGGKVQLLHQAVGLFPDGEAGGDFCPDQLIQLLGLEVLFPQAHPAPCADLSLLLNYGGGLFVEQASLNIYEI